MQIFNVRDWGATADGRTKDTEAIARAISVCAMAGGGRVFFPAGTYVTGPIELKSDVELHLAAGATVLFSRDFDDYPLVLTNFEGEETVSCCSPLWGEDLVNVALTGEGVFDGQGDAWRPVRRSQQTAAEWEALLALGGFVDETRGVWWPVRSAMEAEAVKRQLRAARVPPRIEDFVTARDALRPNMVKLSRCRNVRFEGLTFRNSACWNIHLFLCDDVELSRLTVLNPWFAQNGDGLDIESCRNVAISDCFLDVGDDAICLKSGKDEEGRRRARPTENVAIRRCTVRRGHGGVVVGSEMSGGVRNIEVSDCEFRGTDVGLRFKTARGRGGVVENIVVRNVAMHDILGAAISFNMYYMGTAWLENTSVDVPYQPVGEGTPMFRGVRMENIRCHGAHRAIEVIGLPEMPVTDLVFEHLQITAQHGALLREVDGIVLRDVCLQTAALPAIECHNVRRLAMERVDTNIQMAAASRDISSNGAENSTASEAGSAPRVAANVAHGIALNGAKNGAHNGAKNGVHNGALPQHVEVEKSG